MSNAALKPIDKEAKSVEKPSQKVKDELAARKVRFYRAEGLSMMKL